MLINLVNCASIEIRGLWPVEEPKLKSSFFFLFQGMRDSSGVMSPKDTKPTDLMSEADSIDGRASG